MLQLISFGLTSSLLLVVLIRFALSTLRPIGFPPGPPTIPGFGNIHQIPSHANFVTFASWARKYGPVLGLKVGPNNLVVFNKASHVRSLWVQRGALYAARPRLAVACDYVLPHDYHRQVIFMTPEFHKIQRAVTKHHLSSVGFEKMKPFQQAFAARLVYDLLEKPDNLDSAVSNWSMSAPLYMISGRRLEDMPADWAAKYLETQHAWIRSLDPSATPPLDIFPFLAWVPQRYASWKRTADIARKGLIEAYSALVEQAHQPMEDETEQAGFVSLVGKLVRENQPASENKDSSLSKRDMAFVAGGVFDGAVDTSYYTSMALVKTLAAYPDIQRRIQKELDEAWGEGTEVPEDIDLDKLPYLKCCLLEILRWRPVTPISLARRVTGDDEFLGYRIPKDTTALMNVWAIQHDPEDYHNPDDFDPERFMRNPMGTKASVDQEGRLPLYVFGAGRRACPGEQFAMNGIRFAFAKLLRSFDILADEKMDLSIETGFVALFAMMPKPYKISIVPRSEEARVIIRDQSQRANDFLVQAIG